MAPRFVRGAITFPSFLFSSAAAWGHSQPKNKMIMTPTNSLASKKNFSDATRVKSRPLSTKQRQDESRWMNHYEHHSDLAQRAGNMDSVTREQHWQQAEYFRRLINGSA
jgi:hypothetical protein